MKLSKRIGPDPVEPIELDGMRIPVPHSGREVGVDQNGGYIEAVNAITNEHLWYLMIYQTQYIKGKEWEVQDVFIVKMGGLLLTKKGNQHDVDEDSGEKQVDD